MPRREGAQIIRYAPSHLRATVAATVGDQIKIDIHLDGGASCCLLSSKFCLELLSRNLARLLGTPDATVLMEAADNHQLTVTHEVEVKFRIAKIPLRWRFLAVKDLANKMVLGLDFFLLSPAICDYEASVLRLPEHKISVPIKLHDFIIPPNVRLPDSELFVLHDIKLPAGGTLQVPLVCAPYDRLRACTRRGLVRNLNLSQKSWLQVESGYFVIEKGCVVVPLTNRTSTEVILSESYPVALFVSHDHAAVPEDQHLLRSEGVSRVALSYADLDAAMHAPDQMSRAFCSDFEAFIKKNSLPSSKHACARESSENFAVSQSDITLTDSLRVSSVEAVSETTKKRRRKRHAEIKNELAEHESKYENLSSLTHVPVFPDHSSTLDEVGA